MRRYSAVFKERALSLLKEVGISKTSSELRVTRATLCRWRMEENENCKMNADIVCQGFSNSDLGCLLKKYLEQTAQVHESFLALEKRVNQLNNKVIRLNEMNRKLVVMLSFQPEMER